MLHKVARFHYLVVFASQLFNKICFVFHVTAFDDVMTFEYLKIENLIMARTKRPFEVI